MTWQWERDATEEQKRAANEAAHRAMHELAMRTENPPEAQATFDQVFDLVADMSRKDPTVLNG